MIGSSEEPLEFIQPRSEKPRSNVYSTCIFTYMDEAGWHAAGIYEISPGHEARQLKVDIPSKSA